jgi:nucleoside-diphosphate-sugar epimerase
MAATVSQLSPASKAVSLRFAQLIGPSPVRDTVRLAHKYVDLALSGRPLRVQGGRQRLDYLDLRDAAGLVRTLIVAPFADWPEVLNGGGEPLSVLELANSVADAAVESGLNRPLIQVDPDFSAPDFGMTREKAYRLFEWYPRYSLRHTLLDLFEDSKQQSETYERATPDQHQL